MSTGRSIKVQIDPMGNASVEAVGYNGVGCEDATKNLENALSGDGKMTRVLKPEWSNPETQEQGQTQGIPAW